MDYEAVDIKITKRVFKARPQALKYRYSLTAANEIFGLQPQLSKETLKECADIWQNL